MPTDPITFTINADFDGFYERFGLFEIVIAGEPDGPHVLCEGKRVDRFGDADSPLVPLIGIGERPEPGTLVQAIRSGAGDWLFVWGYAWVPEIE